MPTSPCPRWCIVDHTTIAHPEDDYHDSAVLIVPAVLHEQHPRQSIATELWIVTSQHRTASEPSIYIGEPDQQRQYLRLSQESARRLAHELNQHLA